MCTCAESHLLWVMCDKSRSYWGGTLCCVELCSKIDTAIYPDIYFRDLCRRTSPVHCLGSPPETCTCPPSPLSPSLFWEGWAGSVCTGNPPSALWFRPVGWLSLLPSSLLASAHISPTILGLSALLSSLSWAVWSMDCTLYSNTEPPFFSFCHWSLIIL